MANGQALYPDWMMSDEERMRRGRAGGNPLSALLALLAERAGAPLSGGEPAEPLIALPGTTGKGPFDETPGPYGITEGPFPDPIGREVIRPEPSNPFRPRATDLTESIGEPTLRPEGTLPPQLVEALRAHARTSTPRALEPTPELPISEVLAAQPPPGDFGITEGPFPRRAGRGALDEEGGYSGGRLRFPGEGPGAFGITEGPFDRPGAGEAGRAAAMRPDDRLRKRKGARMLAEGLGKFGNITSASEVELLGRAPDDRSFVAEDARGEEERIRRGDFENPGSPASRMARQMLSETFKQEVPETMSAAAVMALNPMFESIIRQRFAGENRQFQQAMALLREQRAGRGEERAARGEERARKQLGIAEERLAMAKKPTAAQAGEASQIEVTLNALQHLIDRKDSFNTGPIANAFETALNFVGAAEGPWDTWDYSQKNAFKAQVLDLLAQYQKSISGQAISEAEARRLRQTFPAPGDDDKTFTAKARNAIERLTERQRVYIDSLEKAGKDVSGLRGGRPGSAPPAAMPRLPRDQGRAGKTRVIPIGETDAIWVDDADVERGIQEGIWERV